MKRFYTEFLILQTVSAETKEKRIDQTLSDQLGRKIRQTLSNKFTGGRILQTVSAESSKPILIDLDKHFRLGWSHYRLLLGQSDNLKRHFYFEQAAVQRWSVRELQRQIDGALFERVALSRDTRKLASLEKRKGPKEVVRYEDIFKDPYLLGLDFDKSFGLRGEGDERPQNLHAEGRGARGSIYQSPLPGRKRASPSFDLYVLLVRGG
jgi:hypothetical protein